MATAWDDLELDAAAGSPRRFRGFVSDRWVLAVVPQGGIVVAIAARAMAMTLGLPEQSLRTISAVFAGQVAAGEVEVEVDVLRRGRSMSQISATVRNPGAAAGLTAIAVFGAPRRGFDFVESARPDVPAPDGLRSFRDPVPEGVDFTFDRPPMPFWEEIVDARLAMGRSPWEPHGDGPAEMAVWNRIEEPPVAADGTLDVAAAIVLCDMMPGAVGQKVGPDSGDWFGPSADYTIHLLEPARPGWLLAHSYARFAADGYASVGMNLWDPTSHRPVAVATQVMFFAFGR